MSNFLFATTILYSRSGWSRNVCTSSIAETHSEIARQSKIQSHDDVAIFQMLSRLKSDSVHSITRVTFPTKLWILNLQWNNFTRTFNKCALFTFCIVKISTALFKILFCLPREFREDIKHKQPRNGIRFCWWCGDICKHENEKLLFWSNQK